MFSKALNCVFFISVCVFAAVCIWRLNVWGPQYDETWAGLCVARFAELLSSWRFESVSTYLMENPYVGLAPEIMTVPFYVLGKGSLFAFRFAWVFYSVFTLLFVRFCVGRWFGKAAAVLSVVFCALDLTFIHAVRMSAFHEEVPQVFFLWAALFCFELFKKQGKRKWVFACFFVLGFSLWAKIMALAYIFGAVLGLVCFFPHAKRVFGGLLSWRAMPVAVFGFFIGLLPLIVYNLISGFQTIKTLFCSLLSPTQSNWSNLDFFSNISVRFSDLVDVLSWKWIGTEFFSPRIFNPWSAALGALSFAGLLMFVLFGKRFPFSRRKALFLYIFYAAVFLFTAFVPDNPIPGHMVILFPFFNVICALFLTALPTMFAPAKKNALRAVCVVLVAGQVIGFAGGIGKIDKALTAAPASGDFKTVLPNIAVWCKEQGISDVVCSWEYIAYSIEFFSKGKVSTLSPLALALPFEPMMFFYKSWAVEKFWDFAIKNNSGFYMLHFSPENKNIDCGPQLLGMSREEGKNVKLVKEFAGSKPGTNYSVYYITDDGDKV